jgi:hypothetical protein
MNTLLLQVATSEIHQYSKYTQIINKYYCDIHNYEYKSIDYVSDKRYKTWGKIEHVLNYIEYYDRIFFLDADAFVNNYKISLDKFSSNKLIKICRNDENGGELLNTGSIIFLNNPLTIELLEIWYNSGENTNKLFNYFHEQSILNSLHNSGLDVPKDKRFNENIEIFESRAFNSWWLDISHNYKKEQFIQHIMARTIKEKKEIIENYYFNVFNKKIND